MKKVLVTEQIDPSGLALLRGAFEVIQGTGGAVAEEGADCSALLLRTAKVTAATMDAMPKLQVIAKHGIGLDSIDVAAATARGIAVVNAPFANVNAVAEHTVALLLAVAKHLPLLDRATRQGEFGRRDAYTSLELGGKTLGLVGLGRIARLVAQKLSGFGVELVGCDPFVAASDVADLHIQLLPMEEVLRRADFLSLHTPLTPETRHLIGAAQLAMMKPSACLINASRGPVLDEAALCAALKAGALAGAGLDVFEAEPPQADNPLFALENLVVSPHNAALSDAALVAMAQDSAQGILDYFAGKRPEYLCNPAVFER
ncbi:MAG: hydroxyacid dehydrogenase [Pseudoflavonifractor sp.]